jgi:hypothetical protein
MKANSWDPQVVESYVNSATQLASLVGGGTAWSRSRRLREIAGTISTNYILDPVARVDDPPSSSTPAS